MITTEYRIAGPAPITIAIVVYHAHFIGHIKSYVCLL